MCCTYSNTPLFRAFLLATPKRSRVSQGYRMLCVADLLPSKSTKMTRQLRCGRKYAPTFRTEPSWITLPTSRLLMLRVQKSNLNQGLMKPICCHYTNSQYLSRSFYFSPPRHWPNRHRTFSSTHRCLGVENEENHA